MDGAGGQDERRWGAIVAAVGAAEMDRQGTGRRWKEVKMEEREVGELQ